MNSGLSRGCANIRKAHRSQYKLTIKSKMSSRQRVKLSGTDKYGRKHMDRHNRPYICQEIGCEKILGFTYSGGLHRHQREVHHKHGDPKASCLCPHRDCKRSIVGRGFTRKENMTEHLRRVHKGEVHEPAMSSHTLGATIDGAFSSTSPNAQDSRKRRKLAQDGRSADPIDDGDDAGYKSKKDLNLEVKRLLSELEYKDDKIRHLESVIDKLERPSRRPASGHHQSVES